MFLEADKFHLLFQKISLLGSVAPAESWWAPEAGGLLSDFWGNLQRAGPTQRYRTAPGVHVGTAELSKDTGDILYLCG